MPAYKTTTRIKSKKKSRAAGKGASALMVGTLSRSHSHELVKVSVGPKTLKRIGDKTSYMKRLIETFGSALEQSERSGNAVSFVVNVAPEREPSISPVAETAPKDDLESALAAARERGSLRVAAILSADDMLSADDFAELIGTSRVTVNAKRQNHQILGLDGAKRGFRFPAWQIDNEGKPYAALPAIFDRLGGSAWAVYRFLVQFHPELGQTGLDALRRGRDAKAIEAAESVARAFA